jgi:hypothetical protein
MSSDPWFLQNLAPDVLLEGVVMNGRLRGADAVRAQVRTVIGFYSDFTPVWEGEFGDRRVSEYSALVEGRRVTGIGTVHVNDLGQVDHIVVDHRPLSAALTVSRLLGETLGAERERDEFFHVEGQTYGDLVAYAEKHGAER